MKIIYVLHKRIKIVFNVFFKKGLIWNLEIFEMHFHFSDISLIFMIFWSHIVFLLTRENVSI